MSGPQNVTLDTIGNGALAELFALELAQLALEEKLPTAVAVLA